MTTENPHQALDESIELIEQHAEEMYAPGTDSAPRFPVAWTRLQIDMTLMTSEQREKIYQAERLLKEAGLGFDSGSGVGVRDWELDWSLSGAAALVRPLMCNAEVRSKLGTKRSSPFCAGMGSVAYWAVFHRVYSDGESVLISYPYCSTAHRDLGIKQHTQETRKQPHSSSVSVMFIADAPCVPKSAFPPVTQHGEKT